MSVLKPGFERMEATKASLLQSLASLDAARLNRKPDTATWSIVQVVAHLTKSERGTLQYIRKKTQDPEALPRSGIVPWIRILVLSAGIRSPLRFRAPAAIADVPETGDIAELTAAWGEVRDDWRGYVEQFPEVLADKLIFRHPFVGLLGPTQTMMFLNDHLENHVRQIGRIRASLGA